LLSEGKSTANVGNRMRMQFEIQIQEGLKLTTRFDAMERAWGQTLAAQTQGFTYNRSEQNISWERAYVTFNALYGVFDVGYQQTRVWGTCAFCDDYDSDAAIHYRYMMGPWTFGLEWEKRASNDTAFSTNGLQPDQIAEGTGAQGGNILPGTDNDHDVYNIYAIYRWATGQAGLRFQYDYDAATGNLNGTQTAGFLITASTPTYPNNQAITSPFGAVALGSYTTTFYEVAPYVQWKFGPFDLEGELRYVWGTIDAESRPDIDRKGYSFYLMGKYTMGAFYGGLEFAYLTGDDPSTTDKWEAGVAGGQAWDPLLMYGNYWFTKYQGAMAGIGPNEGNLMMFKPFVGWKVNPQLEVVLQYAWLKADEKPLNYISDDYGQELDIYATYKLYNNLSYTVGFGFFMTGDYFKGTSATTNLDDNYLIMNALNFAF
jgi:hypothetical protein